MRHPAKFSGQGISRRDLMKAGAAGLVGLGLPLVAPPRVHAAGSFVTPPSPYKTNPVINTARLNALGIDPSKISFPTVASSAGGTVCVSGTNGTQDVVLVWYIYNAPYASEWTGNPADRWFTTQTLSNIAYLPVRAGQAFSFCADVPVGCHQDDLLIFPASVVQNQPALVGNVARLNDASYMPFNVFGEVITSPGCNPNNPNFEGCCLRMTGGGQTDGLYTITGLPVAVSQGFQLRTGNLLPGTQPHSNLEINFPNPDGSGVSQFHLGPPDGSSNFMCGTVSCASGGGGHPLNLPNCIFGFGQGTLNGQPATVFLNFVDCGEPGVNDTRKFIIWEGIDTPTFSATSRLPVFFASSRLGDLIVHGNNQAHSC